MKKRLYIVTATFHPLVGGVETLALAHAHSLRERGFDTTIITFRYDRNWLQREVINEVPVFRVAGMLLGGREKLPKPLQQMLYLLALVVMGWILWRERRCYDILHVHSLTLLAVPTSVVCQLSGKPIVIVVHNAGSSDYKRQSNKEASLWLQLDERTKNGGDIENLELLGKPGVRLTRSLLRHIGAEIIIISSRMKSYLAAHRFDLPNVRIIPNGVDSNRFRPVEMVLPSKDRESTVVCVSRLTYQKGIEVLLQAWNLVHVQLPHARLIIFGTGPLQDQLERMTETLGIAESVEFTGVQRDVAAQLLRGAIGVSASRWEGMPIALLEAMACGLACVATRVSGSEDVISHEINGLLIEPDDYLSLAGGLHTLLSNPQQARQYGNAARTTINQRYKFDNIMDKYVELYERVTKKSLRVLMVTGIYPTKENPHSGTFIQSQVESLVKAGLDIEIVHPKPGLLFVRYVSTIAEVFYKSLVGRFDIVHGHYGQWCLFARMQWTTPVVAAFLGSDLLGDVSTVGRKNLKGKLIPWISRWVCKHVDAVTVKTEEMKKVASVNDVIVYSDGIDFELFRPIPRDESRAALGWKQDQFYVLFGNNPQRAVKNFPLAEAAIQCLRDRGVNCELVVASGLPQTTLVQYINASNAVILTSFSEGSPNIVKEAMACNVPVVATDVGDVAQLIGSTEGCGVCPHDPNALAEALEKALRHNGPTSGRADIAHLERSAVSSQIIAVYEEIINKKKSVRT
jgi:glycosyltransferase involved in cell wall biosynthesis